MREFSTQWLKPTEALIEELRSEDGQRRHVAAIELERRVDHLNTNELRQIADIAVETYREGQGGIHANPLSEWVNTLASRGVLNTADAHQLFDAVAHLELDVRRIVVEGQACPLRFAVVGHEGADLGFFAFSTRDFNVESLLLNESPLELPFDPTTHPEWDLYEAKGTCQLGPPGLYRFRANTTIDCAPLLGVSIPIEKKLEAVCEVVPAAADPVKRRTSPELDASLRRLIKDVRATTWGDRTSLELHFELQGEVPMTCILDIFVRIDGFEVLFNSIELRSTDDLSTHISKCTGLSVPVPETIDVLLRGSERLTRSSIDFYDVWGGEISFSDVKVEQND